MSTIPALRLRQEDYVFQASMANMARHSIKNQNRRWGDGSVVNLLLEDWNPETHINEGQLTNALTLAPRNTLQPLLVSADICRHTFHTHLFYKLMENT